MFEPADTNNELKRLAIWMLGRCAGPYAISAVAPFRRHENRAVRKEVARALKRMGGGWSELREMAANDPDPIIRRLATPRSPVEFTKRLSGFVGHDVEDTSLRGTACVSRMQMWFRERPFRPHPPKSVMWIRRILERIRRLVHG